MTSHIINYRKVKIKEKSNLTVKNAVVDNQ